MPITITITITITISITITINSASDDYHTRVSKHPDFERDGFGNDSLKKKRNQTNKLNNLRPSKIHQPPVPPPNPDEIATLFETGQNESDGGVTNDLKRKMTEKEEGDDENEKKGRKTEVKNVLEK